MIKWEQTPCKSNYSNPKRMSETTRDVSEKEEHMTKFISWNIDSLNAALTSDSPRALLSRDVLNTLAREDADIIAIQETKLPATRAIMSSGSARSLRPEKAMRER